MTNLFSRLLTLLLCFIMCAFAPYLIAVTIDDYTARVEILNTVDTFVDTVCDTGVCTKTQIDDLNMNIATYGIVCTIKIEHYTEMINPNANKTGVTHSLVYDREITSNTPITTPMNNGEHIVVKVKSVGYTGSQRVVRSLLGVFFSGVDISVPGRVR